MVDLHTHILPGIDDGATSVAEALMMTAALLNQDVKTVVCTPHFDPSHTSLDDFLYKRAKSMALMKEERLSFQSGSETVLNDYLFHYPDLSSLCIGNTRYILIELPYNSAWDKGTYDMLEKLLSYYNHIPIIAHIERYSAIKKNMIHLTKLIKLGCVIQVNASTILNKKRIKNRL